MKLLYRVIVLLTLVIAVLTTTKIIYAHCQMPCGIYQDRARVEQIAENTTTVEKAIRNINKLSSDTSSNINQLVRWVDTKEKHVDDTAHIITYYFLAQRVKPSDDEKYHEQLSDLHQMLIYSMKMRQTTDISNAEKFRQHLESFESSYFQGKD